MSVTEKFIDDSARAAIRALRGLEQTAIMLEKWAPEVFPETTEVNGVVQKHFGRVMMESAAEAIRQAWADAIKDVENADRAKDTVTAGKDGVVEPKRSKEWLQGYRCAWKDAVTWLHDRGDGMNHEPCRAWCYSASFQMGNACKYRIGQMGELKSAAIPAASERTEGK